MTRATRDEPGYDSPLSCTVCQEAVPAYEWRVRQRVAEHRVRRGRKTLCEPCAQLMQSSTCVLTRVDEDDERLMNARDEDRISEARER